MHGYTSLLVALGASMVAAAPAQVDVRAANLWRPAVGSSWQIVLNKVLDLSTDLEPNVDIYDIDMQSHDAATIKALHDKGKKVICYFSAGSYEPYRDDSNQFHDSDLGAVMDGWPDEKWLDIRSTNVRNIMAARIQKAADKGCDAVDPDNVDGYSNENGLDISSDDAIDYVSFLTKTANAHGLSAGLKNANDIVEKAKDIVQFSVNEQCHDYNECQDFAPFIQAGKPVFNIEYPDAAPSVPARVLAQVCAAKNGAALGFSTIIKKMDLDGWVQLCAGPTATTATH